MDPSLNFGLSSLELEKAEKNEQVSILEDNSILNDDDDEMMLDIPTLAHERQPSNDDDHTLSSYLEPSCNQMEMEWEDEVDTFFEKEGIDMGFESSNWCEENRQDMHVVPSSDHMQTILPPTTALRPPSPIKTPRLEKDVEIIAHKSRLPQASPGTFFRQRSGSIQPLMDQGCFSQSTPINNNDNGINENNENVIKPLLDQFNASQDSIEEESSRKQHHNHVQDEISLDFIPNQTEMTPSSLARLQLKFSDSTSICKQIIVDFEQETHVAMQKAFLHAHSLNSSKSEEDREEWMDPSTLLNTSFDAGIALNEFQEANEQVRHALTESKRTKEYSTGLEKKKDRKVAQDAFQKASEKQSLAHSAVQSIVQMESWALAERKGIQKNQGPMKTMHAATSSTAQPHLVRSAPEDESTVEDNESLPMTFSEMDTTMEPKEDSTLTHLHGHHQQAAAVMPYHSHVLQQNEHASSLSSTATTKYNRSITSARIPKRFLCKQGTPASEIFWFKNNSDEAVTVVSDLIPLSTGCEQFTLSPNVLELNGHGKGSFTLHFSARLRGVVSAILQFQSTQAGPEAPPYEVIVDASTISSSSKSNQSSLSRNSLESSLLSKLSRKIQAAHVVTVQEDPTVFVSPTNFIFKDRSFQKLTIGNRTERSLHYSLSCEEGILRFSSDAERVLPFDSTCIKLQPFIKNSFDQSQYRTSISKSSKDMYINSTFVLKMTLEGEETTYRYLTISILKSVLLSLPTNDVLSLPVVVPKPVAAASLSCSGTRLHRSKTRPSGLYFSAITVNCGSVYRGTSSTYTLKLCNGHPTKTLAVTIAAPPSPFKIRHLQLQLRPASYVQLPITFSPRKTTQVGKYSTDILATSSSGKSTVTVVATATDPLATM